MTANACRAITRYSTRKTIEYRGDHWLYADLYLLSFQMADSRLETSLHPVHDLALLPSACVAVTRWRTNERQTRVISACAVSLPRIVKLSIPRSINLWRGHDFVSRVHALIGAMANHANVLKIAANTAYIVTQCLYEQKRYTL